MTEKEAANFLSIIENGLIAKVNSHEDYSGFKYLAIRKKLDIHYFELGYSKNFITKEKLEELKNNIRTKLPEKFILETSFLGSNKEQLFEVETEDAEMSFDYLKPGDEIKGYSTGTLGGFITLKNHRGNFLISNAHVLIGKTGKLGGIVKNDKGKEIAKVFWGLFNSYYDVAIAKVKDTIKIKNEFSTAQISKPSFANKKLRSAGMYGIEKGELYSINALVKIGKDLFKNQILITNLDFMPGDSGSIIMEDKHPHNIIGLYVGGNNDIKVANNLHNLFVKHTRLEDNFENKKTIQFNTINKP